ncbi:MAG: thioredoxin family protein, partial [Candidatus Aminicenantes bacterium]|nr:thioredoxin family protein [Candidatus Aminicenantes bacterium]
KSFKMGKCDWLTEENTFEEVIEIARSVKKPVLAVFSAEWCAPCQMVKKTAFKHNEFKEVSDKAVLLYIEQTTKKGMIYNKRFNIVSFPTFKIFSTEGIMLDTGRPERSVRGFSKWVDEVMSGKNFYTMSKKLEKDPNDRETLLNISKKMGRGEVKKQIEYLKKLIILNPDFNDKLTKEAYEALSVSIHNNYPYSGTPEEKEAYRKENDPIYDKIVKAYYPDKFEYSLKGNSGISAILEWYIKTGNYKKSEYYFKEFIKRKGKLLDPLKDMRVIAGGISSYLYSGDLKGGEKWIEYSMEAIKKNPELKESRNFYTYFARIPSAIMQSAKKLFEKNEVKKGKDLIYSFYDNQKYWEYLPGRHAGFYYNGFAWTLYEAKVSDKKTIEIAENALKLYRNVQTMDTLASVYSQLENYEKAIGIEKEALKIAKAEKDKEELRKKITEWEAVLKKK